SFTRATLTAGSSRARSRASAIASHFDRADADHRGDAASQLVNDVAVIDVDRSGYRVIIRLRLGANSRQSKAGDARLIEQAAKRGMYIAGVELDKKHGSGPSGSKDVCTAPSSDCCSFYRAAARNYDTNILGVCHMYRMRFSICQQLSAPRSLSGRSARTRFGLMTLTARS